MVFHCLNRSVARLTIFEIDADYAAFEQVLEETHERIRCGFSPRRLLPWFATKGIAQQAQRVPRRKVPARLCR